MSDATPARSPDRTLNRASAHVMDHTMDHAPEPATEHGAAPHPADLGLLAVFAALPGPTAVFAADPPHFTFLVASDALLVTTGRPRAALLGRPLAEAFPDPAPAPPEGSGLASLRASLEAALRTGTPQRMARQRYDLPRPDGAWDVRYWDALNTPVRGPDGAVRGVLHQTEDVTERVRAEQAAARAEVRATRVLERTADAHVALDREFHVTYANAAAERALGKTRGEMLGRTHWEVFPASVENDAGRAYRRVVAEGVEQHLTQHYVGEGYDRHLEIDAYPTDEGGVAVFWRDVTDRVQDRSALAAFRTVVEHASDAHAIFDAEGRILWANRLMAERLGYAPEALIGRHVWDIDPHFAPAGYPALFARARAGRVAPFESAHRRRDGSTFPVEVTATVVALPEGERLFSAVRDISERKAAQVELEEAHHQLQAQAAELEATAVHLEEQVEAADRAAAAVRASEERYRAVFDAIDQAFNRCEVLIDADGRAVDYRILEVNPAWARMTRLDPTTAVGRTARELVPDQPDAWVQACGRVALERVPLRVEQEIPALGMWYDVHLVPFGAPDSRQFLATAADITARKRAEAERERLLAAEQAARAEAEAARAEADAMRHRAEVERERAAEANASKSQFLANMSHELRTPLNAIGGYAQLLELGLHGPVTEEQQAVLGRVQLAQRRLLGLINDVLNYAKLEGGRVEYHLGAVDVREVIAEVAPLVEPQAAAKGLALVVRLPDSACTVWADREKLGQVLVNLLSNAVKFTEARHPATGAPGRVTVEAATRPRATTASGDEAVFVRVTDTGRGIPREKQDAIFDPFVQLQTGYARSGEGTGLGLAISRDLARGMGGDLRVRSAPGEGATFTVTLRRADASQADASQADASQADASQASAPSASAERVRPHPAVA